MTFEYLMFNRGGREGMQLPTGSLPAVGRAGSALNEHQPDVTSGLPA